MTVSLFLIYPAIPPSRRSSHTHPICGRSEHTALPVSLGGSGNDSGFRCNCHFILTADTVLCIAVLYRPLVIKHILRRQNGHGSLHGFVCTKSKRIHEIRDTERLESSETRQPILRLQCSQLLRTGGNPESSVPSGEEVRRTSNLSRISGSCSTRMKSYFVCGIFTQSVFQTPSEQDYT